jgi:hypothetical protein
MGLPPGLLQRTANGKPNGRRYRYTLEDCNASSASGMRLGRENF